MEQAHRPEPIEIRVLAALAGGAATPADVATGVGEPVDVVGPLLERALAEQAVRRLDLAGGPTYLLTPKGLEIVGVYQGVSGAVDGSGHVDLGAATRLVMQQYDAARDEAEADALREQAAWPVDDAARDRVTAALNDAYARGALTDEQLAARTDRALAATTMGDLRAAGDGVVQLPAVLPSGVSVPHRTSAGGARLSVNPVLLQVRWRWLGYAAALVVVGLALTVVQLVVGLVVLLSGLVLGGWTLRPLLATGTTRVNAR
jgi:hypothetical protein